jgi:hypothetical protein
VGKRRRRRIESDYLKVFDSESLDISTVSL